MDMSKVISRLEAIEDHAERLKSIENLLEKLVDMNNRQAQYLEHMLKLYEQAANQQQLQMQAQQNGRGY